MRHQLLSDSMVSAQVGVILPTYREADNVSRLIDDLEGLNLDASILVIDDSSPDQTAQIVKEKQKEYGNVLLYVRPKKGGLGSAITDGFKFFLSSKQVPRYIVTMDADYSHDPRALPQLLSNMSNVDCGIVIGSRYVEGGKTVGWPSSRKIISKVANYVAKASLGLKLKDCTSGYRCYSTKFLKLVIGSLHSQTYEIQIETVRQAVLRNFSVKETPILFVNRKHGKSKLTWTEITSFISYTLKAILR